LICNTSPRNDDPLRM